MLRGAILIMAGLWLVSCVQDPNNPMEGLIMSRHAPPKPGQLFGVPMPGPTQQAPQTAMPGPVQQEPKATPPSGGAQSPYYMDVLGDLVVDTKLYPATRELPDLTDSGLSAMQDKLMARKSAFQAGRKALLSTDGALDCPLTNVLRWRIATGMTEREFARTAAPLPPSIQPRVRLIEAVLVEGECRDGRPEGDFVAVGRFESVQGSGDLAATTVELRRVEGTIRNGVLEGELLHSGRIDSLNASGERLFSNDTVGSMSYRAGKPQGPTLIIADAIQADGTLGALTTKVTTPIGPRTERSRYYFGSQLQTDSTLVDGLSHGWMRLYEVQLVKKQHLTGKGPQRLCYQHGRQAPETACAAGS